MPRKPKQDPTVALGNGKPIHLGEYGWYQSTQQYEKHGCLFKAEANEAFELWYNFHHHPESK